MNSLTPLFIFLSILFHSPSPTCAMVAKLPSSLVNEVCPEAQNSTFCMQALGSDHRAASAPDIFSLTQIVLELAIANATDTRGYISDLIQSNKTKPGLKPTLGECLSNYDGVIGSFKSALSEVKETQDYMTANYDCMTVSDEVNNCAKRLTFDGVRDFSIAIRNTFVLHFSNIGFVVTDLLGRESPPQPL